MRQAQIEQTSSAIPHEGNNTEKGVEKKEDTPKLCDTFNINDFNIKLNKNDIHNYFIESSDYTLVKLSRDCVQHKVRIKRDNKVRSIWRCNPSEGYYDFDIVIRGVSTISFRTYAGCCGVITVSGASGLFLFEEKYLRSLLAFFATKYAILEFYHVTDRIIPERLSSLEGITVERRGTGSNPKSTNRLYRYEIDLLPYMKDNTPLYKENREGLYDPDLPF